MDERQGPAHAGSEDGPAGTGPRKIRVLIVDDHPVTRVGLRALIDGRHDLVVCGEADTIADAMRLAQEEAPDLAVVDVSLKSESGLELTRRLREQPRRPAVLVLSMHEESVFAERALRAGACGFLPKQDAAERILLALERILHGQFFASASVLERLAQCLPGSRLAPGRFPIDTLSTREREVFRLLGQGFGTRALATSLQLSMKTIDSYLEHLRFKLACPDRGQLMRLAVEWGHVRDDGESEPPPAQVGTAHL